MEKVVCSKQQNDNKAKCICMSKYVTQMTIEGPNRFLAPVKNWLIHQFLKGLFSGFISVLMGIGQLNFVSHKTYFSFSVLNCTIHWSFYLVVNLTR